MLRSTEVFVLQRPNCHVDVCRIIRGEGIRPQQILDQYWVVCDAEGGVASLRGGRAVITHCQLQILTREETPCYRHHASFCSCVRPFTNSCFASLILRYLNILLCLCNIILNLLILHTKGLLLCISNARIPLASLMGQPVAENVILK